MSQVYKVPIIETIEIDRKREVLVEAVSVEEAINKALNWEYFTVLESTYLWETEDVIASSTNPDEVEEDE